MTLLSLGLSLISCSSGETDSEDLFVGTENHEYVDLGLPSRTLWATCNIGALWPDEYGDYFAWGETSTKSYYYKNTYSWCNGSITSDLTKYCLSDSYGKVDKLALLEPSDDAALVNWSSSWRMPTEEEMQELVDNCNWTWTSINAVRGYLITGPNGKSIFLPATGWIVGDDIRGQGDSWGTRGCYWTSSLSSTKDCDGKFLSFYPDIIEIGGSLRYCGHTIRPVRANRDVPQNGIMFPEFH